MEREPDWDDCIARSRRCPMRDGLYLAHEICPRPSPSGNRDHPSLLGAYGVLPGDGVDRETMRRTLAK